MTDTLPEDFLDRALSAMRQHLGMDVAYISQMKGDLTIFKKVDAPGLEHLIRPGDIRSLDDVYCRHILEGRLPELIPDTSALPLARAMPITSAVPIGSHLSVPIRDEDGTAIGMLCCLGVRPRTDLSDRDLGFIRIFADVIGHQVADNAREEWERSERTDQVRQALEDRAFSCVYQPIWDLRTFKPVGLEALVRFLPSPYRPPNEWFADAEAAGISVDLEVEVLRREMNALEVMPQDLYLSLNASPALVLSGRLAELLAPAQPERILLEITEHAIIDNYDELADALAPLRKSGIRVAIDDAGAGYSTLQHILRLAPDRIKLDMSLTRSVDTDPARRALVSAMVLFARETQAILIAEGIETRGEFETLVELGVGKGQGYFLGRPDRLVRTMQVIKSPPGALA
ncbi:EAL domain-containing protein [Kaistia geumhonensis]|uniref:EAL domain-containing protein (Putative c-di-GMP-specific phosphodiesterase class I) n=1 Tax=Kaistia geumhonensis TaxID=410839 RepID=A0ABU0MCE8_9HYPH|nr:EAL domain-containing protein [Kaistia geumhonensis]MCX5481571.1 EAL domain-containing protein [Kaistia geumhonensis]MDQ0518637.1 EAL domain-containing protein (putative c-di-GMP-specific phosphodiesterase class I) [Kaistia geumhonensis]